MFVACGLFQIWIYRVRQIEVRYFEDVLCLALRCGQLCFLIGVSVAMVGVTSLRFPVSCFSHLLCAAVQWRGRARPNSTVPLVIAMALEVVYWAFGPERLFPPFAAHVCVWVTGCVWWALSFVVGHVVRLWWVLVPSAAAYVVTHMPHRLRAPQQRIGFALAACTAPLLPLISCFAAS
jgi:hypothetical protein